MERSKKALMDIAKTEEGKKVIKIYNHAGYKEAKDEDYNKEREAQKLIKGKLVRMTLKTAESP